MCSKRDDLSSCLPCIEETIMPNTSHHVFFRARDGVSDQEVIDTVRRYRDLVVSKGYMKSANELSCGKVVFPPGGANEVARAC